MLTNLFQILQGAVEFYFQTLFTMFSKGDSGGAFFIGLLTLGGLATISWTSFKVMHFEYPWRVRLLFLAVFRAWPGPGLSDQLERYVEYDVLRPRIRALAEKFDNICIGQGKFLAKVQTHEETNVFWKFLGEQILWSLEVGLRKKWMWFHFDLARTCGYFWFQDDKGKLIRITVSHL